MKTSTIILIVFCILAFASCHKKSIIPVKGRGDSVTKTYERSGFDHVDLSIDADVDYVQSSTYYVEVYAQSNIQDALRITVDGTTLRIDSKKTLWQHKPVRIKIHSPNIYGFELSGSGSIDVQLPVSTTALTVDISGSGSVSMASLMTQNLNASLSGSGKMTISGGSTIDQTLKASGSGEIDVLSFTSEKSSVSMSGSGSARLNVSKNMDVNISGSGSVKYSGTPSINLSISGSGKLIHLN
jgi:hypothetical protein